MSLILWSGGCDSTLVLYRQMKSLNGIVGGVRALSVETKAGSAMELSSSAPQKRAREKLQEEFLKRGCRCEYLTVTLNAPPHSLACNFPQPVLWLSLAFCFLKENENLLTGWVQGDMIWHRIAEVRRIVKEFQKLTYNKASLETPLEWVEKKEVLLELHRDGLLDFCWICEEAEGPCGKCTPCKTHRIALTEAGLPLPSYLPLNASS